METVVLLGGFFYSVALGWLVVRRIGRFLDEGGISPDWDGRESKNVEQEKQYRCNSAAPKVRYNR